MYAYVTYVLYISIDVMYVNIYTKLNSEGENIFKFNWEFWRFGNPAKIYTLYKTK